MVPSVDSTSRVPLAQRVRDQIVQHPESHNQKVWVQETSCGTTACVAGWTVILAGATPALDRDISSSWHGIDEFPGWVRYGLDEYASYVDCIPIHGNRSALVSIFSYAEQLLGLTSAQGDYLFAASRTRKELLRALDNLIRRDEIRHDDFSAPLTRAEERAPLATVI